MAFNERTLMVMGEDVYNRIVKKHIVLIGVGGVGEGALQWRGSLPLLVLCCKRGAAKSHHSCE